MKSVIDLQRKPVKEKYPYLGIYKRDRTFIVLFVAVNAGMVIWSNDSSTKVGHFDEFDWDESEFETFNDFVILSND